MKQLRAHAISHSLFKPTTLAQAVHQLGFVQADPIRSPATAQDLILRQRVAKYRAGDLERQYPALGLEEDYLYAYGFLPREVLGALHPRLRPEISELEQKILAVVREFGPLHPTELESYFGRERVVNAWGGFSKHTKQALEELHFKGLLRITHRKNGVRIYGAEAVLEEQGDASDRLRRLILLLAHIFAPAPERTLSLLAARLRRWLPGEANHRVVLNQLYGSGELTKTVIEGLTYVWPTTVLVFEEPPRKVRLLAPFDPVVWDRLRFEHLWGWAYRFEAYTPPAKRVRGYYALPLLWGDAVIGWANATNVGGKLDVELGFVADRPGERAFERELAAELGRLEAFLQPVKPSRAQK